MDGLVPTGNRLGYQNPTFYIRFIFINRIEDYPEYFWIRGSNAEPGVLRSINSVKSKTLARFPAAPPAYSLWL